MKKTIVETSAKSGEGVERAFLEVAERIYQNIEAGKYDLNDRRSGVKGPGAGGGNAGMYASFVMHKHRKVRLSLQSEKKLSAIESLRPSA